MPPIFQGYLPPPHHHLRHVLQIWIGAQEVQVDTKPGTIAQRLLLQHWHRHRCHPLRKSDYPTLNEVGQHLALQWHSSKWPWIYTLLSLLLVILWATAFYYAFTICTWFALCRLPLPWLYQWFTKDRILEKINIANLLHRRGPAMPAVPNAPATALQTWIFFLALFCVQICWSIQNFDLPTNFARDWFGIKASNFPATVFPKDILNS